MDCDACGANLHEGLFCTWCGQAHLTEGIRLVERLGVELAGDEICPILPYGARLPASWSDSFSTAQDDQTSFVLHLVVGNAKRASLCRTLMNLVHPLQNPGPRGQPRIQVTVHVLLDGSLSIEAHEQGGSKHCYTGFKIATHTQ